MSAEASSSTSAGNGNGQGDVLQPQYTPEQILAFNKELESKTPQEILAWAIDNLDGLYQTTAFGL
jgi:phosphoadenosine phosphosulfate reductase